MNTRDIEKKMLLALYEHANEIAPRVAVVDVVQIVRICAEEAQVIAEDEVTSYHIEGQS